MCVWVGGDGWVSILVLAFWTYVQQPTREKKHEKPMPCGTIEPLPQVAIY